MILGCIKGIFRKSKIDFSSINKKFYPWNCADLRILTVPAVKESYMKRSERGLSLQNTLTQSEMCVK